MIHYARVPDPRGAMHFVSTDGEHYIGVVRMPENAEDHRVVHKMFDEDGTPRAVGQTKPMSVMRRFLDAMGAEFWELQEPVQ